MLLTETQIRQSLERVGNSFPRFGDWEYNNEINASYSGFAVWGHFILDPNDSMPKRYFVTFDTCGDDWRGYLTIGQPCYMWSSADCGDAFLLDTDSCPTLDDAIKGLKAKIEDMFTALMGLSRDPQ